MDLTYKTPPEWTKSVLANFEGFLADHAANERKAAALAMEMTTRYPDKLSLVTTVCKVAIDEIQHFQKVFERMCQLNIALKADQKCLYVRYLKQRSASSGDARLLDQLIINSLVEQRGMERFGLLALGHPDPEWQTFFCELSLGEQGHSKVYIHEAKKIFPPADVVEKYHQWLKIEADANRHAGTSFRLFS